MPAKVAAVLASQSKVLSECYPMDGVYATNPQFSHAATFCVAVPVEGYRRAEAALDHGAQQVEVHDVYVRGAQRALGGGGQLAAAPPSEPAAVSLLAAADSLKPFDAYPQHTPSAVQSLQLCRRHQIASSSPYS